MTERIADDIVESLHFGQLAMWRDHQSVPRRWWSDANQVCVVDCPAGVPLELVASALEVVTAAHASLRTRYDLHDPDQPLQRVRPAAAAATVAGSLVRYCRSDSELDRELRRPFSLAADLAWRCLVAVNGRSVERVILVLNHIVADGSATQILRTGLAAALTTQPLHVSARSFPTPVELAGLQRSPAWADRRTRTEGYWRELLTGPCAASLRPRSTVFKPGPRVTITTTLDKVSEQVLVISRRYGVLPQATLLALVAGGIWRASQRDQFVISLVSANRGAASWRSVVTCVMQRVPVAVSIRAEEYFSTHVRRLQKEMVRAYWHGIYDPDSASRLADETNDGRSEADYEFNYMLGREAWERAAGGDDPADRTGEVSPSGVHSGPRFRAVLSGDIPELRLEVDTSLHASGMVARFVRAVEDGLCMLDRDLDCRMRSLMTDLEGD